MINIFNVKQFLMARHLPILTSLKILKMYVAFKFYTTVKNVAMDIFVLWALWIISLGWILWISVTETSESKTYVKVS